MSGHQAPDALLQAAVNTLAAHGGNQVQASLALGIHRATLQGRLRSAQLRGIVAGGSVPIKSEIEVLRERDTLAVLKKQLAETQRELIAAQDLRTGILGLGEPQIAKVKPPPKKRKGHSGRSAIIHVSDIQYGEFIDPAEIDGVNSYSVDIADARLDRLFYYCKRLLKDDWHGRPVEAVSILLGGDMVSGALHEELAKTDELPELPAARKVAARLAGNIGDLASALQVPVDVFSVPGNHGRLTVKPESKGHVLNNLDTLVAWFVEAALHGEKNISIYYGDSVDIVFDVYGFPMLLTHGDRMGSRSGGTGFIGALAPISKGHQKLYMDYAARGTSIYKIFTGHYHTSCETPWGYGNGSLPGTSQFARDNRMSLEPASQNMVIIHEEHGEISRHRILVGIPSEGKSQDPLYRWKR